MREDITYWVALFDSVSHVMKAEKIHLAWGLGRTLGLFESPLTRKLDRLEPALARLRRRYPGQPVLPGWAR